MGCDCSNSSKKVQEKERIFLSEKIPDDEFLCPRCLNFIPVILSLQVDSKNIDFQCKRCSKFNNKSGEYQSKLEQKNYLHTKCKYCRENPKKGERFYYCYDCKNDFCSKKDCNIEHEKEEAHQAKDGKNNSKNENLNNPKNENFKTIQVNEKKKKCLKHYDGKLIKFCYDCKENICEKDEGHTNHKKIDLKKLKKNLKESIDIIKKKNEDLQRIIAFNEALIKSFYNHKKNYLYLKSLENVSKSFENEKQRDPNDLAFLFNDYEESNVISDKAKHQILLDKEVKIEREEDNLLLSNSQISEENIKNLSLIKFNNLKELNLSDNNIKNIEFLSNMNLPFLELLNLSYNQIKDIKPLGEINQKKIKYLFIQNNQIEDIDVFITHYNQDFKSLEILNLKDNVNIDNEESDQYKKLVDKYNEDIIIISNQYEAIKNQYNIDGNETEIELTGNEEGNSILRKLFIIISQKSKNRIKKLTLSNNKITDPSLLNLIQFDCLTDLDLSCNKIASLNFLKGMKAKNLNNIHLNDNNINDLSPLKNYNINREEIFPYIEKIYLKNNNFDYNQPRNKIILNQLNINNDLND